ncbi:MAG: hypothetical protein KUL85_09315 [Sphingobacterium mizutaii]|nr:hypothetical protein [Sphingobacterium mizutaii]
MKTIITLFTLVISLASYAQEITFEGKQFELKHVKGSIVKMDGQDVLKLERDLNSLPFDLEHLEKTVDEPTYAKLKGMELENGTIEVKLLSRIQDPSPFKASQGFIGLAFRVKRDDGAFESIYLRPKVGRSEDQFSRNHTVQYYSYPDFKFDVLRQEAAGRYETYADVGLDEWITLKIEVQGSSAKLYINNQEHPSFIVQDMKGKLGAGAIALWVDIGTEGYFKDLNISKN